MIIFTCDYCKTKYNLRFTLNGVKDDDGDTIKSESEPCKNCQRRINDIKERELQKIAEESKPEGSQTNG